MIVDKNGAAVTGMVTLHLVEVYTKSEMVKHHLQTMCGEKLLGSAGMVHISFTANGEEAFLRNDGFYDIRFPATEKKADMQLFYGKEKNGTIDWVPEEQKFISDKTYRENEETLDKYVFNGQQIGWVNCDYFTKEKNLTNIVINLPDTSTIYVCAVFKDINAAMAGAQTGSKCVIPNIPVGREVTLVAFVKRGDDFFFVQQEITVKKKGEETLVPEKMDEAQFEERIKVLN